MPNFLATLLRLMGVAGVGVGVGVGEGAGVGVGVSVTQCPGYFGASKF